MKRVFVLLLILCFVLNSASAWTCSSCGNEASDSAKFCGVCGQPSPTPELTPAPTPAPTPELTPAPTPEPAFSIPLGGSYVEVTGRRAVLFATDLSSPIAKQPTGTLMTAINSRYDEKGIEWVLVEVNEDFGYMLMSDLRLITDEEYDRLSVTPTPTPKPTPTPTPTATPRKVVYTGDPTVVGSYVTFGHYEQDNNTSNGKEPIEWIVLKYDSASGKSLLLSRYGLDARRFDASEYLGWDKSEMRSWLNGTFLNNAFTEEEQEAIVTTKVSTPSYGSNSGGPDTQDRIWLLSREEAATYFKNDADRKATPTKYAVANGALQSSSDHINGTGCCWWSLRSPGYFSSSTSSVSRVGSLDYINVRSTSGSVRPAFWLNLDSAGIY